MVGVSTFALLPTFAAIASAAYIPIVARDNTTATTSAPTSGIATANSGVGDSATRGLLVQFTGPDGANANVTGQLTGAVPLIQAEAGTIQWFGGNVNDGNVSSNFVIFDTFVDEAGRTAHLAGQVAGSVVGQTGSFIDGLTIDPFDILAVKADDTNGGNVTVGLVVLFEAQADKIPDVQQFCRDSLSLAQAEPGTVNWLCVQLPGSTTFGILDSFPDDTARQAHLKGKVAAGLFAIVPTLLTGAPNIQQIDISAATVKSVAPPAAAAAAPAPISAAVVAPTADSGIPLTNTATIGLIAPFLAVGEQVDAVKTFVTGAAALAAQEPGTLQWFAGQAENSTEDFTIFDSFATDADRKAHLGGKVAGGLLSQIAALQNLAIVPFDIFGLKSTNAPGTNVTKGLRIFFNATDDSTIPQVQQFCNDSVALINAEPGTLNWICFQIPGTPRFGILDSFPDDTARQAHLNGDFAKSLLNSTLLAGPPEITQIAIFAATSQPGNAPAGAATGAANAAAAPATDAGAAAPPADGTIAQVGAIGAAAPADPTADPTADPAAAPADPAAAPADGAANAAAAPTGSSTDSTAAASTDPTAAAPTDAAAPADPAAAASTDSAATVSTDSAAAASTDPAAVSTDATVLPTDSAAAPTDAAANAAAAPTASATAPGLEALLAANSWQISNRRSRL